MRSEPGQPQLWTLSCPACDRVTTGTLEELRAAGGGKLRCVCKAEAVRLPDLVGQAEEDGSHVAPLAASRRGRGGTSSCPAPRPPRRLDHEG